MKKLNNKGYMLVEIILASVIAFGVAYFILDLVIKLKNKNDDLFVDTLARTDQAIITNTIMRDIYNKNTQFSCENILNNISVEDNKFKYNDTINDTIIIEVNKYTTIGDITCNVESPNLLNIPLIELPNCLKNPLVFSEVLAMLILIFLITVMQIYISSLLYFV